jgi:soluble P-type ATPase
MKTNNIKVSFDNIHLDSNKLKARKLIANGDTCFIISSMRNKADLTPMANSIGIPEHNVYALGSIEAKAHKINELNINMHYE